MNDQELLRYSRHILLNEIGVEGQQRLREASMLVIGAGGLGSPAAFYLASAGVARITLVDGDSVDLTNLQRQILHTTDRIGTPKAASGQVALAAINADVEVVPVTRRADEDALTELVGSATVVLDCSDNFATRHALNRACVAHRKPLVSGAAIRFDGQVAVFDLRHADFAVLRVPVPARRRRRRTVRGDGRIRAADRNHRHDAGGRGAEARRRHRRVARGTPADARRAVDALALRARETRSCLPGVRQALIRGGRRAL